MMGIQADSCSSDLLRTGNGCLPNNIGSCTRPTVPSVPKEDYILLEHVTPGAGRLNEFGCERDCSISRGTQHYRFQNFLLDNIQKHGNGSFDVRSTPKGYKTFSLPVGASKPQEVYWFEEEIALARKQYGTSADTVVNVANLTMTQANIMKNSAVFLTNHGGGRFVALFLPPGAGAIFFWNRGIRMSHNTWESAGYFRTNWVGLIERDSVNTTMAMLHCNGERTGQQISGIL